MATVARHSRATQSRKAIRIEHEDMFQSRSEPRKAADNRGANRDSSFPPKKCLHDKAHMHDERLDLVVGSLPARDELTGGIACPSRNAHCLLPCHRGPGAAAAKVWLNRDSVEPGRREQQDLINARRRWRFDGNACGRPQMGFDLRLLQALLGRTGGSQSNTRPAEPCSTSSNMVDARAKEKSWFYNKCALEAAHVSNRQAANSQSRGPKTLRGSTGVPMVMWRPGTQCVCQSFVRKWLSPGYITFVARLERQGPAKSRVRDTFMSQHTNDGS
ncbi:MAG: hypothetical protein FE78DRAFT_72133 [Acidomyces sp. 'richmondensis']|nr:MAG: hypothetical protein FE78DRAFT_72133 [Acidomyces sp. 'richmondensis']